MLEQGGNIMSDDLKSGWKETGKAIGGAFKSLGKSLFNTGKKVVKKVDEAIAEEDQPKTEENAQPEEKKED